MTNITLKGQAIHTNGALPEVGSSAKDFVLVKADLSEVSLSNFKGKKKLLNIFVSIDTGVCAESVKKFSEALQALDNVVILNISKDLPFAQKRFCTTENIKAGETLSAFRSSFAKDYGLEITDGPLVGLCSRAVVVLDENNRVLYSEQVPEIGQEPNYAKAIEILNS